MASPFDLLSAEMSSYTLGTPHEFQASLLYLQRFFWVTHQEIISYPFTTKRWQRACGDRGFLTALSSILYDLKGIHSAIQWPKLNHLVRSTKDFSTVFAFSFSETWFNEISPGDVVELFAVQSWEEPSFQLQNQRQRSKFVHTNFDSSGM